MITNNVEFYNYLRDKGVWCTLMLTPSKHWNTDELVIAFPNTFDCSICGNRFNKTKVDGYRKECDNIIDWLESSERVIVVTNVIKFGSAYMLAHAPEQYDRLKALNYKKQVIHTRDIGELLNPHRLQIRYKGVEPVKFDTVATDNIEDPMHYWYDDKAGYMKKQQIHYLNVLNATKDKYKRRKLRAIPEYTLFSQLYKKLFTTN